MMHVLQVGKDRPSEVSFGYSLILGCSINISLRTIQGAFSLQISNDFHFGRIMLDLVEIAFIRINIHDKVLDLTSIPVNLKLLIDVN